jgi:DnaJ like chaperone protein
VAIKGKLIGALLGSFAGPMGTILGGVIGHLFDMASNERRTSGGFFTRPDHPTVDSVSSAQLNFLSSLIGLSIAVANADGHVRTSQINTLKSFFRENFPYSEDDRHIIHQIIDETFINRTRLNVAGLCGYYRSISVLSDRLLLLRLLFKIAVADNLGIDTREEALIRKIATLLGLNEYHFTSVQAEFSRAEKRAYQILGVDPQASEADIRSAYRKLASEHHPDRVANLGEEFVKVAEEKFKLINEAYEEIRKERGF